MAVNVKKTALGICLLFYFTCHAYKPVFTRGPEVIWQGALGMDYDFFVEKSNTTLRVLFIPEVTYAPIRNLNLTLEIPLTMSALTVGQDVAINGSSGLGDVYCRAKYKFFEHFEAARAVEMSAIAEIKLPFGDPAKVPSLTTQTLDFLGFYTIGYNSRCYYAFATTGFRAVSTHDGSRPGHEFYLSCAMGPRPLRNDFNYPDFVFLPELDIIHTFNAVQNCRKVPNSHTTIAFLGPAFLWTLKNVEVKAGFQWPLGQIKPCDIHGNSELVSFRVIAGLEANF